MKLFDSLLPGHGFFGAWKETRAQVNIGFPVKVIRLRITDENEAILNLRGIEFCGSDGKPLPHSADWKATQSSLYRDDAPADGLFHSRGVHTKAERGPWWEVQFPEPVLLSHVLIYNRPDRWGARSRTLAVMVKTDGDDFREIWHARSLAALVETFKCAETLGVDLGLLGVHDAAHGNDSKDMAAFRDGLLQAIEQQLLKQFVPTWWGTLFRTLDMFSGRPADDYEIGLLANYINWRFYSTNACPMYFLHCFEQMLPRKSDILRLQDRVNEIATRLKKPAGLIVTRHGVFFKALQAHSQSFMKSMHMCAEILEANNVEVMICYGTLLGARRHGEFLETDDDVDLLCVNPNLTSEAAAKRETVRLMDVLRSQGWRVNGFDGEMHFHAAPPGGAEVDVFLSWVEGSEIAVFMEHMEIRKIDLGLITPSSTIELYGETLKCPGQVDGFLEARYGKSWQTPDHFFEWPWALQA